LKFAILMLEGRGAEQHWERGNYGKVRRMLIYQRRTAWEILAEYINCCKAPCECTSGQSSQRSVSGPGRKTENEEWVLHCKIRRRGVGPWGVVSK